MTYLKPGPKPGKYGKKIVTSITLSKNILIALATLAKGYNLSRSEYIEKLILEKLEPKK